jgi:hypothetical protein
MDWRGCDYSFRDQLADGLAMIVFYSCWKCRAKDEAVELSSQRRGEDQEQFLYRVFSFVGKRHEARKCDNRQLSIAIPEPEQQKAIA